ncbi:MAG TPA: hypothetical protein V6D43_08710 [Candidatus Sericytochromatia bacterium]|jgi:hypothetical protein
MLSIFAYTTLPELPGYCMGVRLVIKKNIYLAFAIASVGRMG